MTLANAMREERKEPNLKPAPEQTVPHILFCFVLPALLPECEYPSLMITGGGEGTQSCTPPAKHNLDWSPQLT